MKLLLFENIVVVGNNEFSLKFLSLIDMKNHNLT